MITIFRVELRPPAHGSGDGDDEPRRAEVMQSTPASRLPDVGERFAFVDDWGRRQAGTIVERADLGRTDAEGVLSGVEIEARAPHAMVVALTVAASR